KVWSGLVFVRSSAPFSSEHTLLNRPCPNSFTQRLLPSTIHRSLLIAVQRTYFPLESDSFYIKHVCFQLDPIDTSVISQRLHSQRRVSFYSGLPVFVCTHLGFTTSKAIHCKLF